MHFNDENVHYTLKKKTKAVMCYVLSFILCIHLMNMKCMDTYKRTNWTA